MSQFFWAQPPCDVIYYQLFWAKSVVYIDYYYFFGRGWVRPKSDKGGWGVRRLSINTILCNDFGPFQDHGFKAL